MNNIIESNEIYETGLKLYKINNLNKAIYAFEHAIELNKNNDNAYNMLGKIYEIRKIYYIAEKYYINAINLKNKDARINLGRLYIKLNNHTSNDNFSKT